MLDFDAGARAHFVGRAARKLAVVRKLAHRVVDVAVGGGVGQALGLELFNEVEHLRDEFSGARLVGGRKAPQAQHIFLHRLREFVGEFLGGDAAFGGAANDLVVDVGDVANESNLITACLEPAANHVESDERAAVADVSVVVDGHAAYVHPDFAGLNRLEGFDGFAQRGINLKRHCLSILCLSDASRRIR